MFKEIWWNFGLLLVAESILCWKTIIWQLSWFGVYIRLFVYSVSYLLNIQIIIDLFPCKSINIKFIPIYFFNNI